MGPTADSSGLGLIVGVLEGAMGGLVGLRAFPGAAHDDVVRGGWVNRRIFFQILAISLVLLNLVLVYTPVPVNTKTGVIYFILVTRIHTFCDTPHLGHHPHPHEIIHN